MIVKRVKLMDAERGVRRVRVFFFGGDENLSDREYVADARTLLPEVLKKSGLPDVADRVTRMQITKTAVFSRKAGCSCGCSPGFALSVVSDQDISVDVK